MIIEKMPEIARAVAEPLSKTEKIVIIDNGGGQKAGAAKVSGYVTDTMAQLPETVEALTGVNIMEVLSKKLVNPPEASAPVREVKAPAAAQESTENLSLR